MSNRMRDLIATHAEEVKLIFRHRKAAWDANNLPPPNIIAPPVPVENAASLAEASDEILEYLSVLVNYPMSPIGRDDSFRFIIPNFKISLAEKCPKLYNIWSSPSSKYLPKETPDYSEIKCQDPENYNRTELRNSIIFASDNFEPDPGVFWIPTLKEYWSVSSWGGCLRFKKIIDCAEYLFSEVRETLTAQLS